MSLRYTKYYMKNPWTIAAIVLALVVLGGIIWWANRTNESTTTLVPVGDAPSDWQRFLGNDFTISYPPGYTLDTEYVYQGLGPGKEIKGISLTIPEVMTVGTNLSTDTRVSVEHAEGECNASRFVLDGSASSNVVDEGVSYSVASATDAGAGNRYEETVYVLSDTAPCLIVRYFVHYAAIDNFDPGTIKEFDPAALKAQFDAIRRSIVVTK